MLGLIAWLPMASYGGVVHNHTTLWPKGTDGVARIPFCWQQQNFADERKVIADAIRGTWQKVAMVDFVDVGACAGQPEPKVSISLQAASSAEAQTQGGVGLSARSVSFWLPPQMQFERLRYLAVHEFGHVIGLQHEQDSPSRDDGCSTSDAWGNITQLGGQWDRYSVMNSGCNTYSNSIGYLSPGDVDSVRILYGLRKVRSNADFDGAGTTDWATWNAATGWVSDSTPTPERWGEVGDKIVPGDYNGDKITDRAIWRPGTGEWWIQGVPTRVWGQNGDTPVPADYNGDGTTDRAIYRMGAWWIDLPGFAHGSVFGSGSDQPVPADYDGDGRADIATWTPGTGMWRVGISGSVLSALQGVWGTQGDIPLPGDYVGEGRVRAAFYRPSTGCFHMSMRPPYLTQTEGVGPGTICFANHQAGDIPVKGRYTGQLFEEPALFRPSTGQFFTRTQGFRNRGPANSLPVF